MENSSETPKTTSDKQTFPLGGFLIVIAFIGILVGLYFVQSGFAKSHLLRFAHEQLVSQNYTVINLAIKEFHNPVKGHPETGKLDFIVRNTQGVTYEGTADVIDETHWLVFHKKGFRITEIHQKK
jgi:hypothetical protein